MKVAIVGSTGAVGQALVKLFKDINQEVYCLASKDSDDTYQASNFNFTKVDTVFFTAGKQVSKDLVPKALASGCLVIDNTSCFRYEDNVPLVVPEVNAHHLTQHNNLIANPNCTTIQLCVALKPIVDMYSIQKIVACTYQAVSGAGRKGINALKDDTLLNGHKIKNNVIPAIDVFLDDGRTYEEWKMEQEIQKIFAQPLLLTTTCVRVPVYNCHSVCAHIECGEPIDLDAIKNAFNHSLSIIYTDKVITPLDVSGRNNTFVSRLRKSSPTSFWLWIVADNLLKGAAYNAFQIANTLRS